MSVWVVANVDYTLRRDTLVPLPNVLNGDGRLREAVRELHLRTSRPNDKPDLDKVPWRWDYDITEFLSRAQDIWSLDNYFDLNGPFMTLYFHRRVCRIVCSWVSWWTFLEDPVVQAAVRRVCRELARLLAPGVRSQTAVYLPDSDYPESEAMDRADGGLADICQWLERRIGPPCPTIEGIYGEDADGAPTSRGYYVERFDDVGR